MGFLDALGIGNQPNQLSLPEILSAIPAIAGPVLMARGKRVGLPLGIGLSAIGGLGQTLADRQRTQTQHQKLADMIGKMPGVTDEQRRFLSDYGAAGGDLDPIVGEQFKRMFAAPKSVAPQLFVDKQGHEQWIEPKAGTSPPEGFSPYARPQKDGKIGSEAASLQESWLSQHPGDLAGAAKYAADTLAQIRSKYQKPMQVNFGEPLSPSSVFGDVNTGAPTALFRDSHGVKKVDLPAGTPVPLSTGESVSLGNADRALEALDSLESTVGALPAKAGVRSASGMMGRKLTEILNPDKLAAFNAARLGAADAGLKAIAQRANKEQFNAMMSALGGANATQDSARKAIKQMRSLLMGIKTPIENKRRGVAGRSASPTSMPSASTDSPPPPPGYE